MDQRTSGDSVVDFYEMPQGVEQFNITDRESQAGMVNSYEMPQRRRALVIYDEGVAGSP